MDSNRKSVSYGIPRQSTAAVNTCLYQPKINFDIPCHDALLRHKVIPLDVIPSKWLLQQVRDEGKL